MSFFISDAWAQAKGAAGMPFDPFLILIVGFFAVFYFMAIRPQQKRAKEHKQMVASVKKGDEVVTTGGILGRVTKVGDNYLTLEIANNVEIKVQRQTMQAMLPKGTLKSA